MIKRLDWSEGNVVAFEAEGLITKQEHAELYLKLNQLIEKYGKLRLFVRLAKMAWPEPAAIPLRISFARAHFRDIEKFVIVTDLKILPLIIEITSFFTSFFFKTRFRTYGSNDELLAKTWISAKYV